MRSYTKQSALVFSRDNAMYYSGNDKNKSVAIMKLHGDYYSRTKNTDIEIGGSSIIVAKTVAEMFKKRSIVFIGYSGNDMGIASILCGLSEESQPETVYWINPELPDKITNSTFFSWFNNRQQVYHIKDDFDSVMLAICHKLELPFPGVAKIRDMIYNHYRKFVDKLDIIFSTEDSINSAFRFRPDDCGVIEAVIRSKINTITDNITSNRQHNKDYDDYRNAIDRNTKLICSFALFLEYISRKHDDAQAMFKKALEISPSDLITNAHYAVFLKDKAIRELDPDEQLKIFDDSENFYKMATANDACPGLFMSYYANFLWKHRNDTQNAGRLYKKSYENAPGDPDVLGNYAGFLLSDGNKITECSSDIPLKIWKDAINAIPKGRNDLGSELYFYGYAHFEDRRQHCFDKLVDILSQGGRSSGFILTKSVDAAINQGHPNVSVLRYFAGIIPDPDSQFDHNYLRTLNMTPKSSHEV